MRIHRLTTGRARGPRRPRGVRRYVRQEWAAETLPVNAFLLEHPAGLCLVDAGQTAAATAPGYFPVWQPFFRLSRFELGREDEASAQVRRLGFDPADVRRVVLTHLHTDHVGDLASFRSADVVVSEVEWVRAGGLGGRVRGYLPQYWPAGLDPVLVRVDGPSLGPFPRVQDLLGDGTLLVVPLPGHTPGHVGVLAGSRALLAGDAAHTAGELALAAPAVADYCRSEGIVILTAHDDEAPELLDLGGAGRAEVTPA